jgi:hypothetical protein
MTKKEHRKIRTGHEYYPGQTAAETLRKNAPISVGNELEPLSYAVDEF